MAGRQGWNLKAGAHSDRARADRPENHPRWQGEDVGENAGRMRVRRAIPITGMCDECGMRPAVDRHHTDANPRNPDPGNIRLLCRYCHMTIDGRLAALHPAPTARTCGNCGASFIAVTADRCRACAEYRRRTGSERPQHLWARRRHNPKRRRRPRHN
jgi:hypothetical protein